MSAVRPPVAAGKYYALQPAVLQQQILECWSNPAPTVVGPCLQAAAASAAGRRRRNLRGLIVPHGSLQDSGMVAAAAYKLLASHLASHAGATSRHHSHAESPSFLLLGTNHFTNSPPACLSSAASWRTPLGDVPVDARLNAALAAAGLPTDDYPHNLEHSIENQLPFLQYLYPMGTCPAASGSSSGGGGSGDGGGRGRGVTPGFSIAPVCVGWLGSQAQVERLAEQVVAALHQQEQQHQEHQQQQQQHEGKHPMLIATSDFTHAGPSYREPCAAPWMSLREHCIWRDSPLLHAVCSGSSSSFLQACDSVGTSLCGRWPVAVFMRVAEVLGWSIELVSYAPSDLYVQSRDINGFAAFAAWG